MDIERGTIPTDDSDLVSATKIPFGILMMCSVAVLTVAAVTLMGVVG